MRIKAVLSPAVRVNDSPPHSIATEVLATPKLMFPCMERVWGWRTATTGAQPCKHSVTFQHRAPSKMPPLTEVSDEDEYLSHSSSDDDIKSAQLPVLGIVVGDEHAPTDPGAISPMQSRVKERCSGTETRRVCLGLAAASLLVLAMVVTWMHSSNSSNARIDAMTDSSADTTKRHTFHSGLEKEISEGYDPFDNAVGEVNAPPMPTTSNLDDSNGQAVPLVLPPTYSGVDGSFKPHAGSSGAIQSDLARTIADGLEERLHALWDAKILSDFEGGDYRPYENEPHDYKAFEYEPYEEEAATEEDNEDDSYLWDSFADLQKDLLEDDGGFVVVDEWYEEVSHAPLATAHDTDDSVGEVYDYTSDHQEYVDSTVLQAFDGIDNGDWSETPIEVLKDMIVGRNKTLELYKIDDFAKVAEYDEYNRLNSAGDTWLDDAESVFQDASKLFNTITDIPASWDLGNGFLVVHDTGGMQAPFQRPAPKSLDTHLLQDFHNSFSHLQVARVPMLTRIELGGAKFQFVGLS